MTRIDMIVGIYCEPCVVIQESYRSIILFEWYRCIAQYVNAALWITILLENYLIRLLAPDNDYLHQTYSIPECNILHGFHSFGDIY